MSYRNGIDMSVLVNGRKVKEYGHQGMTFVESRHGTNYTIKIKNDNGYRVMVVVSVDGLDVITGKSAEESNKGYIVDGYSATEVKGYRLTDTDSAAFVFTEKGKSYVTQTQEGDKRNSGVLGIRVFEEKVVKEKVKVVEKHIHHHHGVWIAASTPFSPTYYTYGTTLAGTPLQSYSSINTGGFVQATTTNANLSQTSIVGNTVPVANTGGVLRGMNATSQQSVTIQNCSSNVSNDFDKPIAYSNFDSGTEWGKKQSDLVKREYFKRGKIIAEVVIYYATKDALANMGIDLTETPVIAHDEKPKAFGNSQYCQPPKGWQG